MSDEGQRRRNIEQLTRKELETDEEFCYRLAKRYKQELEQARLEPEQQAEQRIKEAEQKARLEVEQQAEQRIKEAKQQAKKNDAKAKSFDSKGLKALMNATEDNFSVKSKSDDAHTDDKNHAPADIEEIEDFDLSSPNLMALEDEFFQSRLLHSFNKRKIYYGSEADICSFISDAAKDAVDILELEGHFQTNELGVYKERKMLGCRPDIMVVRDRDGVGLIAIEVKQPTTNELRTYKKVIGHAYDHGMSMKAWNVGSDIVLVSSFKESFIGSLNAKDLRHDSWKTGSESEGRSDFSKTKQSTDEDGKMDIGEHVQSPYRGTSALERENDGIAVSKGEEQSSPLHCIDRQSPPKLSSPKRTITFETDDTGSKSRSTSSNGDDQSLSPRKLDSKMPSEGFEGFTRDGTKRVLYVSKKNYGPHELVKLIYTALKIAKKTYKQPQRKIHSLKHNCKYSFPKALRVRKDTKNWNWGCLTTTVGEPIFEQRKTENAPRPCKSTRSPKGTYYIVGSLGQGSTSNIFQAFDHSGGLVALKVFVVRTDEHGEYLPSKKFIKKAKDACYREKKALEKLYKFLKGRVHVIKIYDYHALVMPIFEPIPKNDRKAKLEEIQKILKEMAEKNTKYEESDIRFRHVGTFQEPDSKKKEPGSKKKEPGSKKKHVILFDFADLKKICDDGTPTDEQKTHAVESQIEIFTTRSGKDDPQDNSPPSGIF